MKLNKKNFVMVIGVLLILIGITLISIYLFYIHKNTKVVEKADNFIEQYVREDDELYVSKDFLKLLKEYFNNKDVIGLLSYKSIGINYPLVKSKDNKEYLDRDIEGKYSPFGTLFIDKDCSENFSSLNTPIYGHHMKDGSMFGKLEKYLEENGIEDETFYIYTRNSRKEYKIVNTGVIQDTKDNAGKLVSSNEDEFLSWVKSSSLKYNNYTLSEDNNFVTLVSCHYSLGRVDRYIATGVLVNEEAYKEER